MRRPIEELADWRAGRNAVYQAKHVADAEPFRRQKAQRNLLG
jgi:hypothetical protein